MLAGAVVVCTGKKCRKNGAKDIAKAAKKAVRARGLKKQVPVLKTACTGHCKCAPVVSVQPTNVWIWARTEEKTVDRIEQALDALVAD